MIKEFTVIRSPMSNEELWEKLNDRCRKFDFKYDVPIIVVKKGQSCGPTQSHTFNDITNPRYQFDFLDKSPFSKSNTHRRNDHYKKTNSYIPKKNIEQPFIGNNRKKKSKRKKRK